MRHGRPVRDYRIHTVAAESFTSADLCHVAAHAEIISNNSPNRCTTEPLPRCTTESVHHRTAALPNRCIGASAHRGIGASSNQ